MKHPFLTHIFPAGAGVLGLLLRIWLFSATDAKGLLPTGHPANAGLYILTALTLGVLFWADRQWQARPASKGFLAIAGACACIAAGIGLLLTADHPLTGNAARLAQVATTVSYLGSITLFVMAFLKATRHGCPYWLYALLTVALMVDTVAQCQTWGALPQLQEYFFPLLASIFLILTAYHETLLAAGRGKPRQLAFFSQGAVFFCLVSLNEPQWPLYLGMALWAALQLCSIPETKEA